MMEAENEKKEFTFSPLPLRFVMARKIPVNNTAS